MTKKVITERSSQVENNQVDSNVSKRSWENVQTKLFDKATIIIVGDDS